MQFLESGQCPWERSPESESIHSTESRVLLPPHAPCSRGNNAGQADECARDHPQAGRDHPQAKHEGEGAEREVDGHDRETTNDIPEQVERDREGRDQVDDAGANPESMPRGKGSESTKSTPSKRKSTKGARVMIRVRFKAEDDTNNNPPSGSTRKPTLQVGVDGILGKSEDSG